MGTPLVRTVTLRLLCKRTRERRAGEGRVQTTPREDGRALPREGQQQVPLQKTHGLLEKKGAGAPHPWTPRLADVN